MTSGLLGGRVAVVTGAGRGIGRAVALAFAREGAKVVVNDLGCDKSGAGADPAVANGVVEEIRSAGGEAVASHDSVTTPEGAERTIQTAVTTFGGLDILVNNAGILSDRSLFDMTVDEWNGVIETDLRGAFLCTQAAARHMRKQRRGGRIINTTSVAGMLGNVAQANEATAKAGIYGLTRTTSIELQKFDVLVNAVAPIARTRLTEELPMFEKVKNTMEPEHVAPLYVFLASDLSNEVSGSVFSVVGGRISSYRVVESEGRIKEADNGIWTPAEIAEHYDSLTKL
jgi:NAD(P)-dependent dehydrogenase (short-subunit alcohol dehydrogenase family)